MLESITMENLKINISPERNPVTYQLHRKETFWQIILPITIVSLLLLILIILLPRMTPDQASVWADISLIWMIMPVMLITVLSLALLIASIYLILRLIKVLPFYSYQIQHWFSTLLFQVSRLDNKAVEPILRIRGLRASISTIGRNRHRKYEG